jgi:hypothetical protein
MRRSMMLAMGIAMTSTALAAQSGGGVAPHVAILKSQADTVRALVLRSAEVVSDVVYSL